MIRLNSEIIQDRFVDAVVTDDRHQLLFLSLWGSLPDLQNLIDQILQKELAQLALRWTHIRYAVEVNNADQLRISLTPHPKRSRFPGLTHFWFYYILAPQPV